MTKCESCGSVVKAVKVFDGMKVCSQCQVEIRNFFGAAEFKAVK